MEDDHLDVSQSGDVVPTPERMVRDSIIKSVANVCFMDLMQLHKFMKQLQGFYPKWGEGGCH